MLAVRHDRLVLLHQSKLAKVRTLIKLQASRLMDVLVCTPRTPHGTGAAGVLAGAAHSPKRSHAAASDRSFSVARDNFFPAQALSDSDSFPLSDVKNSLTEVKESLTSDRLASSSPPRIPPCIPHSGNYMTTEVGLHAGPTRCSMVCCTITTHPQMTDTRRSTFSWWESLATRRR